MTEDVDLVALSEQERQALPAVFHAPVFEDLGKPHAWICAVCWGDGWMTKWPCRPAITGGKELGEALGLEVHW